MDTVGAFDDVEDQQKAQGRELSANVAEDYIEYHRGNVVGHEEEGWLMYLATLTGWGYDDSMHTNCIGQGPPGSGKSLTKNTISGLLDDKDTYTKTSASSNAILDSQKWDFSLVAPMDEYDKIDYDIIEVLKSSNPEDGGYSKDRNVEDPDARGGYSPTEVSADAIPWVLLYAPTSKKGGIDDELEDRALILYFSNDKNTRRGIGRKEFGHDHIDSSAYEEEYIYDTQELSAALRQHVRSLPVREHWEDPEDEDEDRYLKSRSGDTLTYLPPWVWYATEPIFNIDEDYTNRVYGIVANLMKASALLNHQHREHKAVDVYVDEDSTQTEQRQAVVVGPQDVANVLSCLPTLLSTTHQLTPLKRHLLDAVDATETMAEGGTTVTQVQDWLDDNDIPHPSRSTLKNRMDDLAEDYYLEAFERSGGKNGTATTYEKHEQGALQAPNVRDLQRFADRDGIELASEDCVTITPDSPFEGCDDPIRGQPFVESVQQFESDFGSTTDASAFMTGGDDDEYGSSASDGHNDSSDDGLVSSRGEDTSGSDSSSKNRNGGQASLGDVSQDGVSEPSGDSGSGSAMSLDPDGEPENPTEAYVLEACEDGSGPFGPQDDVTHYVGVAPQGEHSTGVDFTETVVDPEHELWQDRPDMRDDRVLSESDSLRELNDAFSALEQKELVSLDADGGPPGMSVLVVAGGE